MAADYVRQSGQLGRLRHHIMQHACTVKCSPFYGLCSIASHAHCIHIASTSHGHRIAWTSHRMDIASHGHRMDIAWTSHGHRIACALVESCRTAPHRTVSHRTHYTCCIISHHIAPHCVAQAPDGHENIYSRPGKR